jgi:hypothetical protein
MVTKSNIFLKFLRYLWVGYGSYLAIPMSFITTIIAIYYLAIDDIPAFKSVFSHFWFFIVVVLVIGVPITCVIGWLHTKYNPTPHSTKDLDVETNADNYRRIPEYWQETVAPLYIELLRGIEKILDRNSMLDNDDKKRIQEIDAKLQALIENARGKEASAHG